MASPQSTSVFFSLLLVPVTIGASAVAQPSLPPTNEITRSVEWPTAPVDFERVEVGRFLDDERRHAFVVADGALSFVYDFTLHTAIVPIDVGGPVNDITRIVGRAEGTDRLFVTGPGRPRYVTVSNGSPASVVPVLSASWAGTSRLTASRDSAAGVVMIAGVGRGGDTVLSAVQTDSAAPPMPLPTLQLSAPCREVHFLDWDHDGGVELVALCDGVIEPFELDGTRLPAVVHPLSGSVACRLPRSAGGDDLAVAGRNAAGAPTLCLTSGVGAPICVSIATHKLGITTPLSPTGLAALDLNGDGMQDLVLSQDNVHGALTLLRSTNRNHPFPAAAQWAVVPPTRFQAVGESCAESVGDFDGDGHPDLLFALDSEAALVTAFHAPQPYLALSDSIGIVSSAYYDGETLDVQLATGWVGEATHLEAVMWRQADPASDVAVPLDVDAVLHHKFSVTVESDGTSWVAIPLDPEDDGHPTPSWPNHDHVYVTLRHVEESIGESTKYGPFITIGVTTMDWNLPEYDHTYYLTTQLKSVYDDAPVLVHSSPSRPDSIGILVTRRELPPFPPGSFPNPGPTTGG